MSAIEASSADTKTPAQILAEKHEHHDAHNPTVEEVVDEDDIEHPPPAVNHADHDTENADAHTATNGVMSAKAAGKQKASTKPTVLDTQDEEAFPSLGGGTKSATAAPGWGAGTGPKINTTSSPSPALKPTARGGTTGSARPAVTAASLPNTNRDHFDVEIGDIDKTKSIDKVLQDAKRKYRVNTGVSEIGAGKIRRFYAEGQQKAQVRQALMDISKAITVERVVQIQVPASVSPTLIGRQGANIKRLEQEHGVRIQIKRDQRGPSTSPEDPRVDIVEVRGDAAATRVVNNKITAMVKEMQPKVDLPLRSIPPEFYPFLAGRHKDEMQKLRDQHNLEINIPQYHTWQAQPPPRAPAQGRPQFTPHGDSHVVLSGDQEAAAQAKQAIEQLVQQLEAELMLEELTAEQVLHPYIVGERGMNPLEFMEQTGCAIVLPPGHQETDDIHIIGPADRIDEGRNLVEQLMAQKYNRPVDLRKQFADAPMGPERHSRALAQYLQKKALEREFLSSHNSEIVFPVHANAAPSWSVISSDQQKAVSAKNDLMKIAQAYPTSRIQLVDMDPFYHQHIEDMYRQQMQEEHGVFMIVPENGDEPVILVYEGPQQEGPFQLPRQRPTSPEVREFEEALAAAQALMMAGVGNGQITQRDVQVPRKHHDRLRRLMKSEQQAPSTGSFPVQIDYGQPRGRRSQAQQQTPESIYLRGPDEAALDELSKRITAFMLEAEQDEKERGYTTECAFPEKYIRNLIGKNGANIKSLRDKHDVEIDAREPGKVKIQGPQKKAEAAKAEIQRLLKQYEDDVSYSIKVDPKYHGELIGKGGENLTKLQAKVDNQVRIDFPRAPRSGALSPDNVSEAGGSTQRQAADEIRIRGPRAKADKIRDELLSLTQYLQDNSYTTTVSVHKDQVRSLIGRAGVELERLRGETGAQIDVPNSSSEGDRVTITIKGTKAAVDKAKSEISQKSKAFDSISTKKITVDKKHHRELIGSKGANIQKIVLDAGGPARSAEAVQFPKQGEDSSQLSISGADDIVDKIVAAIMSFVDERESQVTEVVDIPADQHRLLIGPNGAIRRGLEEQFKISLDVPRRESGKTGVKIVGRPEAVAQAKEHITNLTSQPEGTTILVPRHLHHAISNDGRIFRDFSRQGIKIDHKGQKPPPKPANTNGSARPSNNTAAPLITDDPSAAQQFTFDIVALNAGSTGETGEIPWILIPSSSVNESQLAKAQAQIEAAIAQAREPRHCGYLRLADPRLHRHVIGQRGSTINRIRKDTGCDIQVPGGQGRNEGEEITIIGPEEGVLSARDLILEEIENGRN